MRIKALKQNKSLRFPTIRWNKSIIHKRRTNRNCTTDWTMNASPAIVIYCFFRDIHSLCCPSSTISYFVNISSRLTAFLNCQNNSFKKLFWKTTETGFLSKEAAFLLYEAWRQGTISLQKYSGESGSADAVHGLKESCNNRHQRIGHRNYVWIIFEDTRIWNIFDHF